MLCAAVPGQAGMHLGWGAGHPSTQMLFSSALTSTCGWELQECVLPADISASPSFYQGQE